MAGDVQDRRIKREDTKSTKSNSGWCCTRVVGTIVFLICWKREVQVASCAMRLFVCFVSLVALCLSISVCGDQFG
jgi:hypothetical protein